MINVQEKDKKINNKVEAEVVVVEKKNDEILDEKVEPEVVAA